MYEPWPRHMYRPRQITSQLLPGTGGNNSSCLRTRIYTLNSFTSNYVVDYIFISESEARYRRTYLVLIRNLLVLRNHFPWPICHLLTLHKDKKNLALLNNFRATRKFFVAKFDCIKKSWNLNIAKKQPNLNFCSIKIAYRATYVQ